MGFSRQEKKRWETMIVLIKSILGLALIVVIGIVFGNVAWALIKGLFKSIGGLFRRKK